MVTAHLAESRAETEKSQTQPAFARGHKHKCIRCACVFNVARRGLERSGMERQERLGRARSGRIWQDRRLQRIWQRAAISSAVALNGR